MVAGASDESSLEEAAFVGEGDGEQCSWCDVDDVLIGVEQEYFFVALIEFDL